MKQFTLLLALCLMLTICSGCGKEPEETTLPPQTTTLPPETTTVPPETTLPAETVPPVEPEVIDFLLPVPDGFEASVVQDVITVYVSPNAPRDTSTITVEKLATDESVLSMTKEAFSSRFTLVEPTDATVAETEPSEQATEPQSTEPEDFHLYSMTTMEVDGWPALYCDYTLVYSGYNSHVYRFEVVASNCNYVFTFTDNTSSGAWLDAYKECVTQIDLVLNTDGMELDYSGLEKYNLSCGLSLYAESGMETHKAEGFTACLGSRNVILLFMADNKEVNNLTTMSLEDYGDLLCQTNDLDGFQYDSYGNLCTTFYSSDEAGLNYYNMICLKQTQDSFWVCQIACLADDQAEYARAFSLWASSITEM